MQSTHEMEVRLSSLWESGDVSRSTVFELIKIARINPVPRRVPGSKRPAAFLTSAQLQTMRSLICRINNGETLSQLKKDHAPKRVGMPDVDLASITLPEAIAIVVEAWLEAQECGDQDAMERSSPVRVVA